MKISFELDASLVGMAEAEILAAERAVTGGVRDVGSFVKSSWRGLVVGAGLGQRLANTIRQNNYPPRGESLGAASLVYARPNRSKSASAAVVIDAFDRGVTIRTRNARWLAIPLPVAGTKGVGTERITPLGFERRTGLPLRFVYRRGKPALLVVDTATVNKKGQVQRKGGRRRKRDGILSGEQTVPVFLLVPQARLGKRFDLDTATRAAQGRLAQAILSRWK